MRETEIATLLKKKTLTGWEAGRLVLADSHEVDHGRRGFLKPRDLSAIRAGLTGDDITEYNALIDTYKLAARTIEEAHVGALKIDRTLCLAAGELNFYETRWYMRVAADQLGNKAGDQEDELYTEWLTEWLRGVKAKVRETNTMARKALRGWLPYMYTFRALSELMGVNLGEDTDTFHKNLLERIESYNDGVSRLPKIAPGLVLPALRVDDLKPSKRGLKYVRERIALDLGAGWWEGVDADA